MDRLDLTKEQREQGERVDQMMVVRELEQEIEQYDRELRELRAEQELRPTFERHMAIDHAVRMRAGAQLRARRTMDD